MEAETLAESSATRPSSPPLSPASEADDQVKRELLLLKCALASDDLFSKVDIQGAMKTGSLPKAKAHAAVVTLAQHLSDAKLEPSVGYSQVSGEISFTIPIPGPSKEEITDAKQSLIWTMLGFMPNQEKLELLEKATASPSDDLLANRCLHFFGKFTGVGIATVKIFGHNRTMRVVLGSYKDLSKYSAGKPAKLFTYGPSYCALSGLHTEGEETFEEAIQRARKTLISNMIKDFWAETDQSYIVSDELREKLEARLVTYLESGINGQSIGFLPAAHSPFSVFLEGTAGTGKSTFVTAFCNSFQAIIRKYLDPNRRVDVVKVQLNSQTPDSLRSILCVQGISDWSVERIMEQTLCKGHTVILHLEEVPEDMQQQDILFAQVKKMLEALFRRYSTFAGNVVYMFTSNYPAGETISKHALQLRVLAPSGAGQMRHCKRMLETKIGEQTKAHQITVNPLITLPTMADMRPLCTWWTTLGFQISRHVASHIKGSDTLQNLGGATTIRSMSVTLRPGDTEQSLAMDFDVRLDLQNDREMDSEGVASSGSGSPVSLEGPAKHRRLDGEEGTLSKASTVAHLEELDAGADPSTFRVPVGELKVSSPDGYFYLKGEAGGNVNELKISTLLDMCRLGSLQPGVAVLTGADEARREYEALIVNKLAEVCGDNFRSTEVQLRSESDKEKVTGHHTEIRGGIFKVIDDSNNPNGQQHEQGNGENMCLVFCHVNETGQYMLRELLETNGDSKTHRHAIRKDRVMFVLSVDEGAEVQEMTRSRAHALIQC